MKEFRGRQEFGQVVINGINNGTYRPANNLAKVLLPQPDLPIKAIVFPPGS
jgi:hypothetical protein